MSHQGSRTVIDSLEFARAGETLRGSLPVSGLTRLADSLYDNLGLLDFMVQGGHDARHRPTVTLEVGGMLHLRCQRCLGQLDFPVKIGSTLVIASATEAAASGLDDEEGEWIEPSAQLDIGDLVEEEIILALPYSPLHVEDACPEGGQQAAPDAGGSAFAKLAALRRNLN